jgi:hypothetical protein
MFALTNQPVAAWKAFPASESAEAVAEYRALPVANPRDIVHIENGVWTLTLNALRRILLTEKHSDAPA